MESVQLVEIDLGCSGRSRATVLITQPAWSKNDFVGRNDILGFTDPQKAKPWIDRFLLKAEEHKCSLILFPELSVPKLYVEYIQNWSKDKSCLIVAGTHYTEIGNKKYSIAPIIYNGTLYEQKKIKPAPSELSAIRGKELRSGTTAYVFRNSPLGTFATMICADYFDSELRNKFLSSELDVLAVNAFQADSNRYFHIMNADIDAASEGLYLLYTNSLISGLCDGSSSIFGVIDKKLYAESLRSHGHLDDSYSNLVLKVNNNHFMVLELDIKHKCPMIQRGAHVKPNIVFIESNVFQQKEPYASVNISNRPEIKKSNFDNYPIKEQILSLIAKHGYDDPDWIKSFSSMIFLDRLATLLGHTDSNDFFELQNSFLSYFRIKADDSLELSNDKILVTPEENKLIYEAMKKEDREDPSFTRYKKLCASQIDIQRMHQNYLYAVALGISGTKNKSRIMTAVRDSALDYFFKKDKNISKESHGGWIPYRVPWITARIIINCSNIEPDLLPDKKPIQEKLHRGLLSLIHRLTDDSYWKSGAGTWVSNWEATALSLEAFLCQDSEQVFIVSISKIISYVIRNKEHWLLNKPDFSNDVKSNDTLAAVLMCSVILRIQERYLDKAILSISDVETFYSFLFQSLKYISSGYETNTRQYCTIPQIACYCCEVVI